MVVFLTVSAEVGSIFFKLSDFQNVKLYFAFITFTCNAGFLGNPSLLILVVTRSVKQKTSYVVPLFYFSPFSEQR